MREPNIDVLQSKIDSQQFSEWLAYSRIEPFGAEREDYRFGMIAAVLANVNRDPKTTPDAYQPEDFFPPYKSVAQRIAEAKDTSSGSDVLMSKMMAWAATMAQNPSDEKHTSELRPRRPGE